jgi:PAS domain S-box-containing protein
MLFDSEKMFPGWSGILTCNVESCVTASESRDAFPAAGNLSTIEALVRTLACRTSIGIFLSDPQGRTLHINDRLRRIAELPATGNTDECWLDALIPDDRDSIASEWSQTTNEGRMFSREFRFRRRDGAVRWVMVEAVPLHTEAKTVSGYVGMVWDITRRQLALDALQASEEQCRRLLQQSSHAVIIHSGDTILFVNQIGHRLLGIPITEDLEGRLLSDFFPGDFSGNLPPTHALTEPPPSFERRLTRHDGSTIEVQMVASSVFFNGQPAIQTILTDIQTEKEIAGQLHHATKMEAIATLAGGIAHELNNCLTAILGFSDLALPTLLPESRAHGHVQQVILASKRARDLVMQMLVFGRQTENTKQPISLDIVLKELLRILKGKVSNTIGVREWIPSAISPVFADPAQIHQMCVGLLAHSEQAMSATGGILEVRLDNTRLGNDADNGQDLPLPSGQYVHLTVSYHSDGMNSNTSARLTDPLFTDSSGNGKYLGLEGLQSMLSEHGGAIRGTSTGDGATIDVYLPAMIHPKTVVASDPTDERNMNLARLKESLAQIDEER